MNNNIIEYPNKEIDKVIKLIEKEFNKTETDENGHETFVYDQFGVFVVGIKNKKVDILFDIVTENVDFVLNTVTLMQQIKDYDAYYITVRTYDEETEEMETTVYYNEENSLLN